MVHRPLASAAGPDRIESGKSAVVKEVLQTTRALFPKMGLNQAEGGVMKEGPAVRQAKTISDLGARIQERRHDMRLSQEALAYRLDTSRQTVSNWERGKTVPDAVMLAGIAAALGTTTDALLGTGAPGVRDRALSTRRELVAVGCIVMTIQLLSGFMSGADIAELDIAGAAQFGAFGMGALAAGFIWLVSIMRRTGLRTTRQLIDFASLASRKPGSPTDRILRFASRWFWTSYLSSYLLASTCGMLAGIANGDAGPSVLATNIFMLGVIAIAWTWERHRKDRRPT